MDSVLEEDEEDEEDEMEVVLWMGDVGSTRNTRVNDDGSESRAIAIRLWICDGV